MMVIDNTVGTGSDIYNKDGAIKGNKEFKMASEPTNSMSARSGWIQASCTSSKHKCIDRYVCIKRRRSRDCVVIERVGGPRM